MADSEAPATGSKRRRIALACTSCRTRKSRCDGRRPTCSTCHQLGFECQYDAPDSTTNIIVQKDYVSGLEQRLQHVENLIQRHDDLLTGHLSSCVPTREYCEDLPGGSLPLRDVHTSDGMEIDASVIESEDSGTEMDARTDGLAITFVDERAAAYFGESSNIGFVRYLVASISAIWGYLSKINGRHETELPYTTQLAMAEAFECISSAEETIGMAASVFGGGPVEDGNLGVWFFTLYYVFTAALVVCGGRLNLVKAADALENLDNSNPLVERCVKYIRYLSKLQDYRSDSGIFDAPSEKFDAFQHMDGVDFMRMVDLLDDDSGLGPYLAAELFDASTIDSLTLPL
ncbi:hypothetical protein ACQRIU_002374 [Beauveria bassiana]